MSSGKWWPFCLGLNVLMTSMKHLHLLWSDEVTTLTKVRSGCEVVGNLGSDGGGTDVLGGRPPPHNELPWRLGDSGL